MIIIYKTNVPDAMSVDSLRPFLNQKFTGMKWSFDLEDCDKILRVEGLFFEKEDIIKLLTDKGFHCEEFPY